MLKIAISRRPTVTILRSPGGISSSVATGTYSDTAGVPFAASNCTLPKSENEVARMLSDYRNWLESELKLLGNASHHAYSFGQANMAKRAIERLDQELANKIALLLERSEAAAILAALEGLAVASDLDPSLAALRKRLADGLAGI